MIFIPISKLYDLLLFPFLNKIRKLTARIILQLNPNNVIDICCGTGNQLKFLTNSGINLMGIDNSNQMLKAAKGINCDIQDARNIQFSKNSFDLALIQLALHEKPVEDQKQIIDEAYRIINNSGHLLIVDYEISKDTKVHARRIINSIEFLAGKEHYRNFKEFHKNQCTQNIISKSQFTLEKKLLVAGKSISIQVFKKVS